MGRLLIPSAALLWGLQFALLNPALALLLVGLYGATAAQVGVVLAVYNLSGFLASLAIPAYADRRRDYLWPMLGCGVLTLLLAAVLLVTSSLPVAVIGLLAFGGPAGVGIALLFAQLSHSGADRSEIVNTRAVFSFAWIAGPPLATLVMGWFGNRSVLAVLAVVAVLNIATSAAMLAGRSTAAPRPEVPQGAGAGPPMSRPTVALVVVAFVVVQATNNAVVSVMGLFVTKTLGLDVLWAGIALGVAAGLEIPALLLLGRLGRRHSELRLIASGCLAGIVYYAAMVFVTGPVLLLALQGLNAWFYATIAGAGMALFQRVIPRPGLATGLFFNTRRLGAIASGPIIGFGASTALGYGLVFAVCAALTAAALGVIGLAARPRGRVAGPEQLAVQ